MCLKVPLVIVKKILDSLGCNRKWAIDNVSSLFEGNTATLAT